MPFGESMNSIIKSNKKIMLDKSRHFRKTLGGYASKSKPEYDFPKANQKFLIEFRNKLKARQRKKTVRVVFIFLITIFTLVVVYYKL
jgi:hypothetical protein